ncbi:MAG: class I SAM-dependent methyltransferase [Calothrix sp. C42_A2020_038]|nr:class I SAM-dependent methyltransferase [Calothrix sp. C42_A2020_038]
MDVINEFSKAYYHIPVFNNQPVWTSTYWQGIPVLKCPLDLWLYQEIIFNQQPDFIVECGVAFGGTTAFLADMCKLTGKGEVIGVDIEIKPQTRANLAKYQNIRLLEGSSIDLEVTKQVFETVENYNTLVILDSDHTKEHVLQELMTYSKLVPSGGYLIVEDTNINGHPVYPEYGLGPMEAVEEFLSSHPEFYIDKNCHKFLTTFNPNGYLKKV